MNKFLFMKCYHVRMPLRIPSWKVIATILAIVAVVVIVSDRFFGSTITPPPDYPDANLRIDVTATFVGNPQRSYSVTDAFIPCPILDASAGASLPPWCGAKPMNLPQHSDAAGATTLWFRTTPPPRKLGGEEPPFVTVTTNHPVTGKTLTEYVRLERVAHDHFRGDVSFCKRRGSC